MEKFILISGVLIFYLGLPLSYAQTGTVSGTVADNSGEVLPGVNVVVEVEGRTIGASTDTDGQYTIENVPEGRRQITAKFIGFQAVTKEVQIVSGETSTVNFELSQATLNLNEVVVTGTGGPVEKRKIGNTIGSVKPDELDATASEGVSGLLEGKIPGVSSTITTGTTGGGSKIRIRGLATLSQNNEPLVYINGARIDNAGGGLENGLGISRLDDINPESIDRIEVLKGASAATLFGSEASNGVIQIFTKQGISGPPKVNFEIAQSAIRMPDSFAPNAGFARNNAQADTMSNYFGGNIQPYQIVERNFSKERYGYGFGSSFSTSISGGNSDINYYVGLRHQRENGPFKSEFDGNYPGINPIADDVVKRSQANVTVNIFPVKKLNIRADVNYSEGFFKTIEAGNNVSATLALSRYSKPELVAFNNVTGVPTFRSVNESLQKLYEQNAKNFIGSLNLNYSPLKNLSIAGTAGINYTNTVNTNGEPFGWNIDNFGTGNVRGTRNVGSRNYTQITFDLKATLDNQFNENIESTFIVGTQGNISEEHQETVSGINFPGPGLDIAEAASQQSVGEFRQDQANLGIFGQEQIGFNDYIFTTIGGRFDATSSFGSDFNAAFYPKVSVSVVPSDAPFWRSSDLISSLRFRFAVGKSGLQPGAFDAFTTYSALASPNGPGIVPDNLGDPDLKPEVSTEYETGVDASFFSDRISIDATYWNRTVRDALINRQFPTSGGFRNAQLTNIAQLNAQGVELGINTNVLQSKDLSVNLSANGSYLWQEVGDLGGLADFKAVGSYSRTRNYIKEGYAPASHFGAKLIDVSDGQLPVDFNGDGNPDSESEVLNYLSTLTPNTADLPTSSNVILQDTKNGDPLGFYKGKPYPDWSGSIGANISYKRLSLGTRFQYQAGNYYINNLTYAFRRQSAGIGRNLKESATVERNYITGGVNGGTPQNNPQIRLDALKSWLNNQLGLSPFSGMNTIEKADFIRWSQLSLSYDFGGNFLKNIGANNFSLTFSAQNLALWSRFDGPDPQVDYVGRGSGGAANLNTGIAAYGIPIPRRYTLKLNVQF